VLWTRSVRRRTLPTSERLTDDTPVHGPTRQVLLTVAGEPLAVHLPRMNLTYLPGKAGTDLYEYSTLYRLQDYCWAHPAATVFYMHSKGSTSSGASFTHLSRASDLRQLMQCFMLYRFKDCLAALDRGYNTCGINSVSTKPFRFFAGNFW
jgi:hypothetical protein